MKNEIKHDTRYCAHNSFELDSILYSNASYFFLPDNSWLYIYNFPFKDVLLTSLFPNVGKIISFLTACRH